MNMLRALLAKDLRRTWRNPVPWLINLLVPLCITALIGIVFGGKSDNGALGRVRFALVDEDQSPLTRFLSGAAGQREGGKYLDPVTLDRATALRQLNEDKLSAAVIIPTNFTRSYLTGRASITLELIKNPAQSIHPAVLEELLGALVSAMNALERNFQSDFPDWYAALAGNGDYRKIGRMIERTGDRINAAGKYISPPIVWYEKDMPASQTVTNETGATAGKAGGSKSSSNWNLFGFLLIGMVGMFLLFLAGNGMVDLYRELQQRTFERYLTLRHESFVFVAGKVLLALVLLWLGSAVMLGGGALIFRIRWPHPGSLVILTMAYSFFAAGLVAVMVALMPDERRAGLMINLVGMFLAMAGGCTFPAENLPTFLRDHITPLLPTYWFVNTVRQSQWGGAGIAWGLVFLKLTVLGAVLMGLSAFLFRRRFALGAKI
jgi:ABC-type multidrug transport system permease subunit